MSLHAMTWAMYGDHRDLDPTARMILVVLADHAGPEFVAWPSRATLARAAGCSTDTVDRRLAELVKAGLIRNATEAETPAAWQSWRADRRPRAYVLAVRGRTDTGPQVAAPSTSRGRNTPATGPQTEAHGAALLRHEPKEPERTYAREADGPTGAAGTLATIASVETRLCSACHVLHTSGESCTEGAERRRRAREAASSGMTAVRQAMRERANA